MKIRLAAVLVVAAAALCACSSGPATPPAPSTSAVAVHVAPHKAASRDACALVTAADLQATVGVDVATGKPVDSYLMGTSCEFDTASADLVMVQTSPRPDEYLQEAKFESMYDGVHKLGIDGGRGFVAGPNEAGVGHLLVVRNGFGVDVSIAARSHYDAAQEQALATLIAGRL